MKGLNQAMAGVFLAAAACCAAGCSGGSPTAIAAGEAQALTLDVLTLSHVGRANSDQLPSARYILLADGTFHAEAPLSAGSLGMPPRIRRLDARELASIRLLADAAVGDPNVNEAPINMTALRPPRQGQLVAVVHARGDQRRLRRVVQDDLQRDDDIAALLDALEQLAWSGERPAPVVDPGPIRYDFGPDPYSRYRRDE